ncbi:MAG: sulfatase-like hydrolase/transferase [Acidobacteriota bacterium]
MKAILWTGLLLGSALAQEARSQTPTPANLILITVDTLRADYVSGINSRSLVPTPAIDSLARDGVVFLQALTTNPLTTPAHASLMTGVWPPSHGVRDFTGYRLSEENTTLAETLTGAGYATAAFVSAAVLDKRTGIGQGFETYDDSFGTFLGHDARVAERSGKVTIEHALKWLVTHNERPFFLWLHLFEPHHPYRPPAPYRARFPGNPYAGEVAYADSLLEGFFAFLKKNDLYHSSVVTLLADHGEGLGDHAETRHGFFIYQSTVHIPWIIKFPREAVAGKRLGEPVSIVDVMPTLLHALGIGRDRWPVALQGSSQYRLIRSGKVRSRALYIESLTTRHQFGWSALRAVVQGRFKFIDAPNPELYDLEKDGEESSNIFESNQALGNQLREILKQIEAQGSQQAEADVSVDPELQERLRSLGYVGVQAPLPSRTEEDLADPKSKIGVYEKMQRGVDAAREQRWNVAIPVLLEAAHSEPRSPAIVASLALAYRDAGHSAEAVTWFEKVIDLTPEDVAMRSQLARHLLTLGRDSQARAQLEAILSRDPRNVLALYNLGTLMGRRSRFEEAIGFFNRALEIREDGATLRSLALAQTLSNQWRAAEKTLQRALRLQPRDRVAHRQLARVYQHLGEKEKARLHTQLSHPQK